MTEATPISLGPTCLSTLFCMNLEASLPQYCEQLALTVAQQAPLEPEIAELWQQPGLAGSPCALLANAAGEIWLRIVEVPEALTAEPLKQFGWMALEVSVQGVDELAARLEGSAFDVLRPPADLDISDQLRACQVQGPSQEVFYFTEIKGPVPGFDLSPARCPVDRLFIPVLCSPDRNASSEFYDQFQGTQSHSFDTVVSVVNQAWGFPLDTRQPIATVALAGGNVIEIDELPQAGPRGAAGRLSTGIASISFLIDDLDQVSVPLQGTPRRLDCAPYEGRRVAFAVGPAGEWMELVERPCADR